MASLPYGHNILFQESAVQTSMGKNSKPWLKYDKFKNNQPLDQITMFIEWLMSNHLLT